MKRMMISLSLILLTGCASDKAIIATDSVIMADGVTTAIGLSRGLSDANPLIGSSPAALVGITGAKLIGNHYVMSHATPEQRSKWTKFVLWLEGALMVWNLVILL